MLSYKLRNNTGVPNKTLHKIIKFCYPNKIHNLKLSIKIKYCPDEYGFEGEQVGKKVVIGISRTPIFPYNIMEAQDWLVRCGYNDKTILENNEELLVSIISHELRHVWQYFKSKQFAGKKLKFKKVKDPLGYAQPINAGMERNACMYSAKMVNRWRQLKIKSS